MKNTTSTAKVMTIIPRFISNKLRYVRGVLSQRFTTLTICGALSTVFLLLLVSTSLAQHVSWTKVGHPRYARKIAGCRDGRLYALNADKSLWVNRSRGADEAWRRVAYLPSNTMNITCAANNIYFQTSSRELWRVLGPNDFVRIGRPWAAAEIAGATDITLDFPVFWALNDDKTLWRNGSGGADGQWHKVGQPRYAEKIAATMNAVYALNGNKTFWRNTGGGNDSSWELLDRPSYAIEIAAASSGPSHRDRLYALNNDYSLWEGTITRWIIELDWLRVLNADEEDEGFWDFSDGDEPYFIMINFRSRFNTSGSTRVFHNDFTNDEWAEGSYNGDITVLPQSMGRAIFDDVNILSIHEIMSGEMPELIGSVVISMESDATPWSEVRGIVNDVEQALNTELVNLIERGRINLLGHNPSAAETQLREALIRIMEAVRPSTLEKIRIGLTSYSDPDLLIGFHIFLFAAVTPTSAITIPHIPNGTVGFLHNLSLYIQFQNSGVDYQVSSSVY